MYADDTTLFCCLEDVTSDNKEVVLCNDTIQSVNEFIFLGLYINSKLNRDTHTHTHTH